MSDENISTLKIMTLGRRFKLGMLYDFPTDQFLPDILLWGPNIESNKIDCRSLSMDKYEVYKEDTFKETADLLEIDDNLKLSVFTGLVDVTGPARLIDDPKTKSQSVRFIFKHSIKTHLNSMTMTYCSKSYTKHPEVFNQERATHVVTDILYGADMFFIFERKVSDDENTSEIEEYMEKLFKKIDTFHISHDGQLNWKDYEKALAETITCRYYGDFLLEPIPTTFKEVVQIYQQLPGLLGENNENTVPKQISIYPLYLLDDSCLSKKRFHQIDNSILSKSLELIDNLHRLQITLKNLKRNYSSLKMFGRTKEELTRSIHQIADYETDMKREMMDLLPKIRNGSIKEVALTSLLNILDLSPANKQKLNDWIGFKTEEINIFKGFIQDFKRQSNINRLTSSFTDAQPTSNREFILRLIIHVTEQNDPFLNELFQNFNDSKMLPTIPAVYFDNWINQENYISMKEQIALFFKTARDNIDKQNMEFIVNEEYTNNFLKRKRVTTLLYHNGVSSEFEIPSELEQPRVDDVSNQTVTLSWRKPVSGGESIREYKVYGQNISKNQWKLLSTTSGTTAVIPNLFVGKYRFKIQGTTLIGDTDESDVTNDVRVERAQPIVPVPSIPVSTRPAIEIRKETSKKISLDVTPVWYKPIKHLSPDKIQLPSNYDKNSATDVRTYECLSMFRSMNEKTDTVDFNEKPFEATVDNPETVVVALNELVHQLGSSLAFTDASHTYDDSAYRTACGVADLGNIHTFLASEGKVETAKFDLHMDLDYDDIKKSDETIKDFVLQFINDMSTIAQCDKEFIRVLNIRRTASINIDCGISLPHLDDTRKAANSVRNKLNRSTKTALSGVFEHIIKEDYEYKVEPVLVHLQIQQSDLDPAHNMEYTYAGEARRGGYPYYFPEGWYRHALKVKDKYPDDKLWLGMSNTAGEWAVAYHGTHPDVVRSITDGGLLQKFVNRDICKEQAHLQNPSIPNVKGLYVATHCNGGADCYPQVFPVKDSTGVEKNYEVVFQCRVEPRKFTEHEGAIPYQGQLICPVQVGRAWRVFDEKAIRPYGLLLKSV